MWDLATSIYYIKLKSHLSVCLHSFLIRLLILPSLHESMPDLLEMKAICAPASTSLSLKVSISYRFLTPVRDNHLCRTIQPLTTAIQCKIGNAVNCRTCSVVGDSVTAGFLASKSLFSLQWSGIESLQIFYFQRTFI